MCCFALCWSAAFVDKWESFFFGIKLRNFYIYGKTFSFFVCLVFSSSLQTNEKYTISISPMTTKSYLCYWSEIGMFADERRDEGQKHLFFSHILSMQQNLLNFFFFASFLKLQINGNALILILIANNVEHVSLLVL